MTGSYGVVGGGCGNNTCASCSNIAGGRGNSISCDGTDSTIGGGHCNNVTVCYGTVGGGCGNCVTSKYGIVVGGDTNTAGDCSYVTIVGGCGNTSCGVSYGFIGGGKNNTTSHTGASIVGSDICSVGNDIFHTKCLYLSAAALPTSDPGVTGIVYRDCSGNLKISL